MQISKKMLLALVMGGVIVGSMVSVAAQTDGSSDPEASAAPKAMGGFKHRGPGGPGGPKGPAIRSISVLPPTTEGGEFRTVRTDQGTLKGIDGSELTISEADGTTVQIAVQDDTTYRREGEDAKLSDLREGDHVHVFRIKEGDGAYKTEHVGAISKETFEKMEAQRKACRADPSSENCPRRGPGFGRFGKGEPGNVQRAPFPAPANAESSAA